MSNRRFLFLLAGGRIGGNSEFLARRASANLPTMVAQDWIRLYDFPLPPFLDIRHSPGAGVYPAPDQNGQALLDATLAATDLVIVAPLYWYGPPAAAKLYLDHWSGWLRVPGVEFRARMAGKTLWIITTVSDEDRRVTEPLINMMRLTANYMAMNWGGVIIGYGNRPGDVAADKAALAQADAFFGTMHDRATAKS